MFKRLFNTEDKKRLLGNFFSLSVLQLVNYALPLLTIPYLIRVIGIEKVGLLAFITAIIAYFGIITDYGFNLTATRALSINRNNQRRVNQIFSSVMIIKFGLMLLSFLLLCLIVFSIPKLREDYFIYFLTFGTVIGQILFPVWFFQGMEKMKYITYLNICSRLIFTIAIFVFVKIQTDFYLVPLFTSLGSIVAGLLSLAILKKKFAVTFSFQKVIILKYYLKDGWHIFVTTIFMSFYRNSNVIILGLFTADLLVGYYSIAERVIKIIQSLQDIVGRTLFPYFSKKFNKNKNAFFELNKKIVKYVIGYYLFVLLVVFIFAGLIVRLLTGHYQLEVTNDLRVMSLVILFGGLNYYYGVLGLVMLNYKKEFTRYILNTGVVSLILCFIGAYFYQDLGASMALTLSEFFLFTQIIYRIRRIKKGKN